MENGFMGNKKNVVGEIFGFCLEVLTNYFSFGWVLLVVVGVALVLSVGAAVPPSSRLLGLLPLRILLILHTPVLKPYLHLKYINDMIK
jgi:hypothetical protein